MSVITIISLTEAGQRLATRVGLVLNTKNITCELWHKPQPFTQKVQQAFTQGHHLLFICATGIVVRTLAPVIANKHDDPPVLVMDELGQFIIPLLSGHEGGANQWANELALVTNAQLVITTAKPYLAPIYTIGMGCERDCPKEELAQLLGRALKQAGITLEQVHSINSIDIKACEVGLIECAKDLDRPYQTFNVDALSQVEHLLSTKSDYIYSVVGVYGVAESAALVAANIAAGDDAELVLNKIKTKKATCAIARAYPKEQGSKA